MDEDSPGWGHPCHLDTFLFFFFFFFYFHHANYHKLCKACNFYDFNIENEASV